MKKPPSLLTEHELEIMKLVWKFETPTVRDVYEALRERRTIAYTTVMTMMNLLVEKGHLKRRRKGRERAYLYRPCRPRRETVGDMLGDFIDRVFNGSARPLLVQLVEDGRLNEAEVEELRALIREEQGEDPA